MMHTRAALAWAGDWSYVNGTPSTQHSAHHSTHQGYEASAKVAEETKGAALAAPRAIVLTVLSSGVVGWLYLLATTFSIQVCG